MWRREVHRDFFWTGFLLGIVFGGVLGVFFGSEAGRRTRDRLEQAAMQVRRRLNGTADAESQRTETPDSAEQPDVDEAST